MNLFTWAQQRLGEPSTFAGLATLAVSLGSTVAPQFAPLLHYLTVAAGAIAVALQEGGNPTPPTT